MSFWREEVVQFALSRETQRHMDEQLDWIRKEPSNPRPYYNLAQLYRIDGRTEEALGLLLEAIRVDDSFAEAHASLVEIYAVNGDCAAAWRHARVAERGGVGRGVDLLLRYAVPEP
jgi:thioredoxin-like negative regulator of GroEL